MFGRGEEFARGRSGGSPPFDPLTLEPYLWYRTDAGENTDYVLTDNKVSKWVDHSGNGKDATQGTSSARPVISDGGLLFSGAQFLNFSRFISVYGTIFLIGKSTGSSSYKFALGTDDIDNGNNHWFLNYSGNNWRIYYSGQTLSFMQDLPTIPTVSKSLMVGTKSYKSMGGEIYGSSHIRQYMGYLNNIGSLYIDSIGYVRDNPNHIYSSNDIYYELLIYNKILSIADRGKIVEYLTTKHSVIIPDS